MELIKDVIKGSAIYYYYLMHPEDEFINKLMNQSISVDASLVKGDKKKYILSMSRCHCFCNIIKNDRIDIIYDVIPNMRRRELQALARAAVEDNNKEILELLYKNQLATHFYVRQDNTIDLFLTFAYKKHGLEMIKCMNDIGFDVCNDMSIIDHMFSKNDNDAINYIVDNTNSSIDEIFLYCIHNCNYSNTKSIVEFFMEKIDVTKYKNDIFETFSGSPVDDVKWFLEYGTIDSNSPLMSACSNKNIELIEFYLQYGLHVDREILDVACRSKSKEVMNLFLKYDVDFSLLKHTKNVDYEFVRSLERNGFDIHAWFYSKLRLKITT